MLLAVVAAASAVAALIKGGKSSERINGDTNDDPMFDYLGV